MKAASLVAVMALVTMMTRFLPFLIFRRNVPPYIAYLGKTLPPAIIGMLAVYSLKDTDFFAPPFGMPELIASACVAGMQAWRRNALISILAGTAVYMMIVG